MASQFHSKIENRFKEQVNQNLGLLFRQLFRVVVTLSLRLGALPLLLLQRPVLPLRHHLRRLLDLLRLVLKRLELLVDLLPVLPRQPVAVVVADQVVG